MKINFICSRKKGTIGLIRYSASLLKELKKRVDIKLSFVEERVPSSLIMLARLFGKNLEAIIENYPIFSKIPYSDADIIHFSGQNLSLARTKNKKVIVTVYDLIPFDKRFLPGMGERILNKCVASKLKKADKLIAISEHTKKDIIKYLGLPPERIEVIYCGVDHSEFRRLDRGKTSKKKTERKKKLRVLYVGSEMPRKNVAVLLKAFAILKENLPNIELVKIGESQWPGSRESLKLLAKKLSISEDMIWIDKVGKSLAIEYNKADLFVFPSLYEGFGFPVIEAMACGCPVICSDKTSLPEVVGNAAIYFDGYDVKDLAKKMHDVLTNEVLRLKMTEAGLAQARKFSWQKAAQKTLAVYKKIR